MSSQVAIKDKKHTGGVSRMAVAIQQVAGKIDTTPEGLYGHKITIKTGDVTINGDELDVEFDTPVSDNLVYQNFPAIIFGFPLMLIAANAPENPVRTLLIAVAFFTVLNVILFRAQIFGKKKKK